MKSAPTVIVLAAGLGSRFSGAGHKLAQPLEGNSDAGTVLSVTLRNAIASRLPVRVVATAALAPLAYQQIASCDVVIVPAQAPGRGMGDSLAAGVSASADAPGWLVLPGDMPRVRPATLQKVAEALRINAVAYAQYNGRRGHPVGFAAELYSELVALSGDEGARRLIARYPAQAVEVDDAGVLIDIDTVQDLAALRAVHGGNGNGNAARPPRLH
jgi:molybdenum cofactor cytidylyltransferase